VIIIDSDIAIDVFRKHPPAVKWIASVQDVVCVPGFVVLELYQGCFNKQQTLTLTKHIGSFGILWPDAAACEEATDVYARAHLTHALGILDALIGATSKGLGLPLHSFNAKHFAGFPGLQVVEPYVR
jgi:predicted nucleic acid-binding protein